MQDFVLEISLPVVLTKGLVALEESFNGAMETLGKLFSPSGEDEGCTEEAIR
jgi:hypothetical protein